jgi:hypothetical protein
VVPITGVNGPPRPSLVRAAIIVCAAAWPAAIPPALVPDGVSGIAASDV